MQTRTLGKSNLEVSVPVRAAAEALIADGRKAMAVRSDVTDEARVADIFHRTVFTATAPSRRESL